MKRASKKHRPKISRDVNYTAHHEAAHAVIATITGIGFTTSEVSDDGDFGETKTPDFTNILVPLSRAEIPPANVVDKGITVLCAGYHGARLGGEPAISARLGADSDYRRASELLPHASCSLGELDELARQYVATFTPIIRRVAHRLAKRGRITLGDVHTLAHNLPRGVPT